MLFTPRPKSLGKENFLKLADKEEVTGIFRGEIHTFKRHWVQATQRSVECVGEGCPVCPTDTKGPSFRFRINFITSKDGKYVPKIFEGGGKIYDNLVNLDRKFDLAKTVVEIQRIGLKQETTFNILPRKDLPISAEMEKGIQLAGLLPLNAEEANSEGAA